MMGMAYLVIIVGGMVIAAVVAIIFGLLEMLLDVVLAVITVLCRGIGWVLGTLIGLAIRGMRALARWVCRR